VTYEEANSDFINWIKQRSRWYKGYLQTWLVHMREPARLWRELGAAGFIGLNAVVGATPIVALLNPLLWILFLAWFAGRLQIVEALFPAWLLYPAIACALLGNALALLRTAISVRAAGHPELLPWLLLMPVYWLMMSLAAIRALAQLLVSPWHWEKTTHGLSPDYYLGGSRK
jgi:cellulose synthase/poly-beta-1,6-N-acetylglucosamine synthase-like glycosyltransferase